MNLRSCPVSLREPLRHDSTFVPGLVCTEDLFGEQIASFRGEVAISVADHTRRHDEWDRPSGPRNGAQPICAVWPLHGGSIAFEMMHQAPDRIERLALLDTSALSDTSEQTERRLQLIAMAQTGGFKSVRDILWPLFVGVARQSGVETSGIQNDG